MEWSTQAKPELLPGATGLRAGDAPLARSTPEANAIAHRRDDRMRTNGPPQAPNRETCTLIFSALRSHLSSQKEA